MKQGLTEVLETGGRGVSPSCLAASSSSHRRSDSKHRQGGISLLATSAHPQLGGGGVEGGATAAEAMIGAA